MISVKSRAEVEKMRRASQIVAAAIDAIAAELRPGVTTAELDRLANEVIRSHGGVPSFKGYRPFTGVPPYPSTICASVNDELVHGIPGKRVLLATDIVSIDVGAIWQGYHGDAATTFPVGDPTRLPESTRRLLAVTQDALYEGIAAARGGQRLGDISAAIGRVIEEAGFSVAGGGYGGHGVGRRLHEDPHVPNEGVPGRGPLLQPGMTLALEPMAHAGGPETTVRADRWTVATADGQLSAHFEHTVCITAGAAEILTRFSPRVYERVGSSVPSLAVA